MIAGILISIRKCYMAKNKIAALVSDSLSSLENINQAAPQLSRLVEAGGIQLGTFCSIAARFVKIEVDLIRLGAKMEKNENKILNKINKIHLFCSATETVAGLESIQGKLSQMETEVRLLINSVESNMKNSVVLEALGPVLAVAEKIVPDTAGFEENQQLLADARRAFGTHVLKSRLNRLISRSTESMYSFIMGKMFFAGIAVGEDFQKSASFFQCAINY